MVKWKQNQPPHSYRDLSEYDDEVAAIIEEHFTATMMEVQSVSGYTIDPFTREKVLVNSPTWVGVSGIVTTVMEDDTLLASGDGLVKIGDLKVTYPYHVYQQYIGDNDIVEQVKMVAPHISGIYTVVGKSVDIIASLPVFVDFALQPQRND